MSYSTVFDFRADLAAWPGSVGLIRADGKPKPGWQRFTEAIAAGRNSAR